MGAAATAWLKPKVAICRMRNRISETLPAGGNVFVVVGIVFLVLLVLELLGAINIFNKL